MKDFGTVVVRWDCEGRIGLELVRGIPDGLGMGVKIMSVWSPMVSTG